MSEGQLAAAQTTTFSRAARSLRASRSSSERSAPARHSAIVGLAADARAPAKRTAATNVGTETNAKDRMVVASMNCLASKGFFGLTSA
jgi:hypothetical protein